MALAAGSRLGPYEILAPIGAGGMGEVYRARDSRLKRDVALKVLPDAFACDPERLARFTREAEVLAALNHPNIAAIYGIEESALVMELVPGETLAEIVRRGPLPLKTALQYVNQIADALEAAHEKGIVHRDLKPANVKVTPEGRVKVLDFGLAAVMQGPSTASDVSNSPTLTISPTRAGVILGTAAYMSPEQARGTAVDQRADIWAFGLVLYEMLTSKPAFAGDTVTDILAAIMKEQPNLDEVPEEVRPALARCLSKDRRARWGTMGDIRWALEKAPHAPPLRSRSGWGWPVAGVAVLVAAIALWAPGRSAHAPAKLMRFEIPIPEKIAMASSGTFALSPDGSKLAYYARGSDGGLRLWLRAMDSTESRPLSGTEVSSQYPRPPFWSPDSRWIAYPDQNRLKKVDITGGPPQTLCDFPSTVIGGSWNRDGVILLGGARVMRVSASGGAPSAVTTVDTSRKEQSHVYPFFLPDGRHFFYWRESSVPENNGIFVGSLDAKPDKQSLHRVAASDYSAAFVPHPDGKNGELLFLREGTLLAQLFDLSRLNVTGEAVPVAEDVGWFRGFGFFSAADSGILVYRRGGGGDLQFTWFDRQGKPSGTVGAPGSFAGVPTFSPDGKQIAVPRRERQSLFGNANLWLLNLAGDGAATKFTFDAAQDNDPVWSPDGSQIVFTSNRDGVLNLYRKPVNGAREEELLLTSDLPKHPTSMSREGKFLLYLTSSPKNKSDIWILPDPSGTSGSGQPMLFQDDPGNKHEPRFSPDGRWIAYVSDESGRDEIYVREFVLGPNGKPEVTARHQISNGGGISPTWHNDGKELIYWSNNSTAMSVEISTRPAFRVAQPRMLFQLPVYPPSPPVVSPDGKRFLAAMPAPQHGAEPFTVVLNFTDGLKR
jgi:serine/threonine protein kinase